MPRRLLLLGGGPVHAQVLAAFARQALAGVDLTLLTPDAHLVHPALLPDFAAGRITANGCRVETTALAQSAGATWVRGRVASFQAATGRVTLTDGRVLEADWVSVDEPGEPDHDVCPGSRDHALAWRPAAPFVTLFEGLVALASERVLDVVVIGAGRAAVELTLALADRLGGGPGAPGNPAERARLALIVGDEPLLASWPKAVREAAARALARARVTVFRERCQSLRTGTAVLGSGARLACDAPLLATPLRPPGWLAASGLALAPDGWPAIDARGQNPAQPTVFGAARLGDRGGPALAAQLRRALSDAPLVPLSPRAEVGRWLRLGRGRAVVAWGSVALAGHAAGAWCARRDRQRLVVAPPAAAPTRSGGS